MSSIKFSINEVNIHKGAAYPFFNILRPPPFLNVVNDGNIAPTISDRSLGTWVANKGTWVTATIYPVGSVIVDQNGNAEIVTAIIGTGTSGAAEPSWPTVPLKTVIDNTGSNQITWMMLGRVGTAHCTGSSGNWVASFAYLQDDEIRDANGNIQWCLIPGVSAAAAPTWATVTGQITAENGGPTWYNLGPTIAGGSTEGNFEFDMTSKKEAFTPDQATLPVTKFMVSEEATMGAEMRELSAALLLFTIPHGTVTAITDAAMPAGSQSYNALTTGGLVTIPNFSMCVLSPRPLFSQPGITRFITAVLQKASADDSKPGLGFTRTKISGLKGAWGAMHIDSWPQGARAAGLFGL